MVGHLQGWRGSSFGEEVGLRDGGQSDVDDRKVPAQTKYASRPKSWSAGSLGHDTPVFNPSFQSVSVQIPRPHSNSICHRPPPQLFAGPALTTDYSLHLVSATLSTGTNHSLMNESRTTPYTGDL
ncbi:hypothetical protein BDZ85DRAFT_135778 [Elsinoe ampelina]|uniref:Uncharacterized protein n=1 Tax=Elsinoe ampelina TaxID=302913 RepID=A0A6A6G8C4_9PEZI|nr:hypothetical protein BDZ85DRAFT_135778 [Elsinoe ampelina]